MNIETQAKLLKLKGLLNEINHISYTYAQFGRQYPMDMMNEDNANRLITVYNDLLLEVRSLIMNYENSRVDKTT